MQQIDMDWPVLLAVAVVILLVAVWLFGRASRKSAPRRHRPDVLDEGAAPAQRNQALIDSAPPPAAAFAAAPFTAAPAGEMMGGVAEVIAAAVQEEADRAGAAETSPGIPDQRVDDLTRIKGLGPKLSALLATLGVTSFAQIAAWTDEDLSRIDSQLGAFAGRPARDQWVEQARLLAAGDTGGYEGRFGKL
jgi:predicted flap endonuclease-1-like 5' DNA nuclease